MTTEERQKGFVEGLNALQQQYGVILVGNIEHERVNLPGGFTEASRIVIVPVADPNWRQENWETATPGAIYQEAPIRAS